MGLNVMQVTAVEVREVELDEKACLCHGHVLFHETRDGVEDFVHFLCSVPANPHMTSDAMDAALAADAKRQMLRMPEYRTGQRELVFLPGCEPMIRR